MQANRVEKLVLLGLILLVLTPPSMLSPANGTPAQPIAEFAPTPSMPLPVIQGSVPITSPVPKLGTLRILVIAAYFTDENNTQSIADLRHVFFGELNDYYKEISFGAVSLQGDVLGWYKLKYVKAYYGRDCIAIDDTDCSGVDRSYYFASDAWAAAQPQVNMSRYDYYLFVHAGPGQESSGVGDDIWSITYVSGIWITSKAGSLNRFAILPEVEAKGADPLGVYAHELGHLLGLPDLYDTTTGKSVMGPWSLMDKGIWNGDPPGSSPAHMEAWSKIYLGWITGSSLGIAQPNSFSNFTIIPTEVSSSGVHAVEVPISTGSSPDEYYLLELRQRLGFDSALPSSGLLITFVNEQADHKVTVIDAHPNVANLMNATWQVGQTFVDNQDDIAIAITGKFGNSYQVTVNRLGPMPDLALEKVAAQPVSISPNTTVTVVIDIANLGTLGATNVPVQVTLDGRQFANLQVSVAAGATSELTLTWKAVAGRHEFKIVIDPLETVQELSRSNDTATLDLNVGPVVIITVPLGAATGNATAWVKVNGILYHANESAQVATSVTPGPVTVEVQPAVPTSLGIQQSFVGWSDGSPANPRQLNVTSNTALGAVYKTQYLLTVDRNGGVTTSGGWYDPNSTVTITVTTPTNVTQQESRMVFSNWSGDANSSTPYLSITMVKPITVRANWKTQFYLKTISSVNAISGGGWYDSGAAATVSVQSPVNLQNDTRYLFTGWNGSSQNQGSTASLVMNAPTTMSAQWSAQYLVQVNSAYGNPQGAGWYFAGSDAKISVSPQVDQGNRTRRIFNGWSGDSTENNPNFTLKVNAPKILNAEWLTQYQLTFKDSGLPNATSLKLSVGNDVTEISTSNEYRGWFEQGQQVDPITNQTIINGFMYYHFTGWKNSTGAMISTPIMVNSPQDLTAVYSTEAFLPPIPGFPLESILAGFIVGLVTLVIMKKLNRRKY